MATGHYRLETKIIGRRVKGVDKSVSVVAKAAYNVVDTNNSINITASAPVSVYAFHYDPTLSSMFTVYPTGMLGTNYCVLACAANKSQFVGPGFVSNFYSEIVIVATEDGTGITILLGTGSHK